MNTVKRITLNSLYSMAIDIIVKATRALVFIMIARYLGPDRSGAFAVALSYQVIFQTFTMAGADYWLVREVAKNRDRAADYFTHITAMKVVFAVVSWVVLLILLVAVFRYSPTTNRVILLLALTILPEGIGEACRALFVALERLLFPTIVAGVVSVVKLAVSYLMLRQDAGIEAVAWVVVAASGLNVAANLAFIFGKLIRPTWTLRWGFFRSSFLHLVAFAGISVLRVLEYHVTVLLLSFIGGEHQVGIYNAAYTLVLAVLLASQGYASGAMPTLSRLYAESRWDRLALFYRKSVQVMWAVALPMALVLIWFSPTFIFTVYTVEYTETIPVLQVLSLVILFTLFIAPHVCIILAADLQNWVVYILLVSIAANVLTGVVLMPHYGVIGAAVARVIATAAAAVLYRVVVYMKVVRVNIIRLIGLATVAGGIMTVIAWSLHEANPWLALLSGGGAYLAILALLVVFSKEDRQLALQMLGGSRTSAF